ncbi:MAG: hypothetical protein JO086_12040, partial [Acidimicrobiia bacterium]|nr:hypothetical protein [Acidimicrobiia bacterium]
GALPVPWELMGGMAGILTDHAGKGPYPSFADDRRAPNHPDWSVFEFDKPPIAPTSKDPTGFQDGGLGAELINPKQIDKMHDPSKDQCSVGGKAATGLACTAGGPGDLRPGSDGGGVGVGPTPTSVLGPVSPIDCLSHPDKYHHDPSTGLCTGPAATTTTTGPDNQDPLTPQGDNSQALGPAPQTALPMRLTASVSPAPSSATTPPTTAPAPTTTGGGPLPGISDTAGATPSTTTPAAAGTGSPTTTTPGDRIGPSNPFGGGLGAGQQQPAKLPRDPGNWDKIDPQGVPEAVNYIMRQLQVRAWQELNCPQMAAAGAYTAAHPVPAGTHPSVDQLACADWSPAPAPVANDGPPGAPPPSGATPTTQPTNASTKSDKPTGPTSIDDLTSDRLAPPNDAFWERILNDMIYQRYACPPERWTGADPRQPEPASPDGSAVVVLPVPCPAATYHDGDPPPPQCPAGEQPPSEKCSYPPPPRLLDPLPPLPALGHRIIEEGWRLADFDAYASLCPTDSASSADGSTLVPAPGPSGPGSPEAPIQANNARTIIGIAKTENLGKQGALIGLMAGLGESTLTDEANRVVPPSESYPGKEADPPPDGHSVGIMQQQPNYGWSTIASGDAAINNKDAVWQIMTQAYAAEAFFGSPPGSQAPPALAKGLQNVAGWQTMTPAEAAAKVQGNRDGWRTYAAKQEQAQRDLDAYYDDAQPVALPVPLNGGPAPSLNGDATSPCQSDNTNAPSIDGCKNPFVEAGWATARTDQGVDYVPQRALPVRAICDGTVLDTAGHGWPGGVFILLKLTSGPFTGKCAYVAEHLSNVVPPGTHVAAGDVLGTALPGSPWTEWGWAAGPGTPSVRYGGAPDGTAMAGGKAFARFLRSLGAPTRDDPGQGPLYEGASCA